MVASAFNLTNIHTSAMNRKPHIAIIAAAAALSSLAQAAIHADGQGYFPVLVIATNSKTNEPLPGLEVRIENPGKPNSDPSPKRDLANILSEDLGKPVTTDNRGIALVFHFSRWGSSENRGKSTYGHGMTGTLVVRTGGREIYRKGLGEWAKQNNYVTADNTATRIMLEIPPDRLPAPEAISTSTPITKISASEIGSGVQVTGHLGLPLGEVCKIEAVAVDGDTTRLKADAGFTLLRVTKVNGREHDLGLMRFRTRHSNTTDLNPTTAGSIIGKSLSLTVYETGAFEGVPAKLPPGSMVWQGKAFGFETWLEVLQQTAPAQHQR